MQARCPQCSATFQTERTGAQFCPNCGQQVNVADVGGGAAAPAGAAPASAAPGGVRAPTPWERRAELGVVQGFLQNIKQMVVDPDGFWGSVRPDGPMSDALFFGWIVAVIGGLVAAPFQALMVSQLHDSLAQFKTMGVDIPSEQMHLIESLIGGPGSYALLAARLVLYPLTLIISGAIVHLGCLIFGAAKNGFNATVRVIAYASAPAMFAGIPVIGSLLAIYIIVMDIWGIMKTQETTGVRATGGVLGIPVALGCCIGCGAIFALSAALGHH